VGVDQLPAARGGAFERPAVFVALDAGPKDVRRTLTVRVAVAPGVDEDDQALAGGQQPGQCVEQPRLAGPAIPGDGQYRRARRTASTVCSGTNVKFASRSQTPSRVCSTVSASRTAGRLRTSSTIRSNSDFSV